MAASDQESDEDGDEPDPTPRVHEEHPDILPEDSEADQNTEAGYPAEKIKLCGRFPLHLDPRAFLEKPANIDKTRRSAEGNYSWDHDRIVSNVGLSAPTLPRKVVELEMEMPVVRSSVGKVLDLAEHQRKLLTKTRRLSFRSRFSARIFDYI